MPANEIHVGDVGTKLTVVITDAGTPVDISTASTKNILLLKPDGKTLLTKAGTFTTDGTNGSMYYIVVTGDLDTPGEWQIQALVIIGATTFHSDVQTFTVYPNIT